VTELTIATLVKLVLSGLFAFKGGVLALVPTMKGADAFFGVPVSEDYFSGDGARRRLQGYRAFTALCIAVTVTGVWLLDISPWAPTLIGLGILSITLGLAAGYALTRPHRVALPTPAAAASLEPRNRWLYVRPGLEALSLIIVVGSIAYLGSLYVWAPLGQTPMNARRMLWPAQFLTLMQVQMFVAALLALMGMAQSRATLPVPPSPRYLELREKYMRLLADQCYLVKVGLIACFALTIPVTLWGARNESATVMLLGILGPLIGGQLALYAGWLLYYWPRMKQARAEMQALVGSGSLERSADSDGWVAGFVYYCPENPSVWVEKRMGYGYTLNFARGEAWGLAAALIAPTVYLLMIGP
jgi:hypothetical protein